MVLSSPITRASPGRRRGARRRGSRRLKPGESFSVCTRSSNHPGGFRFASCSPTLWALRSLACTKLVAVKLNQSARVVSARWVPVQLA